MCYFVTIGVPARHRQLVEALQRGRFRVDPAPNPFVAGLFPDGDALFTVTDGHCSCGLYLQPKSATAEEAEAEARVRYRTKGWSEAKITRALQSRRDSAPRREDKAATFRETCAKLVEAIGHVRVFAHMYNGDIDTENVGMAAQSTMPLQDFMSQKSSFPADTVVELVRDATTT